MRPRRTSPSIIFFVIAAFLLLLLCIKGGTFGFIGRHPLKLPFLPPIPAGRFILLFVATWFAGIGMMIFWPRGMSQGRGAFLLLGLALLCRLALLPHPVSDDVNRYLWEGKMLRHGISPYAHAPLDPALAELAADDPFHAHINHPDMPAAYPPGVLMAFAALGSVSYSMMAIKLLVIACDLTALVYLLLLLRVRGLPLRWATLYAFNPVVLYAFAGQAHFDAIHVMLLLITLLLYDRRQWELCFLMAGMAVQGKYVAILALPFLLRRDNWRHAPLALLTMLLPFVPIMLIDHRQVFYCIVEFGEKFAFNGSVHGLLMGVFGGHMEPATLAAKFLLVVVLAAGYFGLHPQLNRSHLDDPVSGCFFALGALLVLSPTVHFWYLTWIVPFLCLRPTASWLILTLTCSLYFVTNGILHHTGEWRLPMAAQIAEWLPFSLLLLHEGIRGLRRLRAPVDLYAPSTVSVIVPARDEEHAIGDCVKDVLSDEAVTEVIVVDGGSSDRTAELARKAGAIVLFHSAPIDAGGGRGGQIAAGVTAATGDVIAIVHADARVTTPEFTRMLSVLRRERMIVGGAIGTTFTTQSPFFALLTAGNDFKAALFGISFGDQIQFFLRRAVVLKNAFPAIPLMEDLELALRLKNFGRTTFLFGDAQVSSRRWESGRTGRAAMILKLCGVYLWQRLWGTPDTVAMYRRYYGRK